MHSCYLVSQETAVSRTTTMLVLVAAFAVGTALGVRLTDYRGQALGCAPPVSTAVPTSLESPHAPER